MTLWPETYTRSPGHAAYADDLPFGESDLHRHVLRRLDYHEHRQPYWLRKSTTDIGDRRMQLIGMLDSPFVRRVAISMRLLDVAYEHNPLSIFRGYEEFRRLNPLVKVPTLVCDDGEMLVDSTLIIDHVESLAGRSLMPAAAEDRRRARQLIGIALAAMEKVAQRIYELKVRPEEYRYAPWLSRLDQQLGAAIDAMEIAARCNGERWLVGARLTQADITTAVAWRFIGHAAPAIALGTPRPALDAFGARAESLPEFLACPIE